MNITTHITAGCVYIFILACLGGCSAGGFQGSDNTTSPGSTSDALLKRVNGRVSKGIIRNGNVSFNVLNSNGTVGTLLKTTSTNTFGHYSTSVTLTGPTLLSVSGGVYTDEATGLDVPQDAPLRAAVDTVSSVMTIAITPLTELAVRKADIPPLRLVASNIATANKLVSNIFKVDDIITTQPLDPTSDSFAYVTTTQAQKDYTLVLAAVSQMANDDYNGSVSNAIAAMNNDLAKGDTLDITSSQFKAALVKFLQSDKNKTGVRDINTTNLINAGGGTMVIKLATNGTLQPGALINGITLTIALPPGMTVRISDFSHYQADSRAVYASGVFSSSDIGTANTIGHFVPASGSEPAYLKVSVPQATSGSGLGEFLTVVCDLPVGATYNASDFTFPYLKVVDHDGIELKGVTVQIL